MKSREHHCNNIMAELSPGGGGKAAAESPRSVRAKRDQVLSRYANFKDAAKERRERLESARKFQQFRRDAQELESWVTEKLQVVSDETYKDRTNLQVGPTRNGTGGRISSVAGGAGLLRAFVGRLTLLVASPFP